MALSANHRGALLMAGAMIAFPVSDACMKVLGGHWPLGQSLALRGLLTTLVLGALAWRRGAWAWVGRRDAALVALRAGAEVAASWCYLSAVNRLPLATVSSIQQTVPLAVTLAAMAVLGERAGAGRLLAIAAGFGGVLLVIRPGAEGFSPDTLLVLGSVAAVTVRDIAARALSRATPSLLVATVSAVAVTASALAASAVVPWAAPTPAALVALGGTAGAVVLGYMGVIAAMRVGEVAVVTPFRYTSLLASIASGAVLFGAWPDRWTLAGAGVIVGAGLWTILQPEAPASVAAARARPEEEASPGA